MATSFDSQWDAAAARLDGAVDGILGDRVRYRHAGVWLGAGDPPVIPAFVIPIAFARGEDMLDETLGTKWRVKVLTTLIDYPVQTDRIAHPKLGAGMFRPAGTEPETEGRYWIFDVQKASA